MILWEFHIMHPNYNPFKFLSCPPCPLVTYPQKKLKRNQKGKSTFWYLYTHRSMVKFIVAWFLNRPEFFCVHNFLKWHKICGATLQHHCNKLYTFSSVASSLVCYSWGWWSGSTSSRRSLSIFSPSQLCNCSHRYLRQR